MNIKDETWYKIYCPVCTDHFLGVKKKNEKAEFDCRTCNHTYVYDKGNFKLPSTNHPLKKLAIHCNCGRCGR